MARAIDITGHKFGKLTALRRDGNIQQGRAWSAAWVCVCECGTEAKFAGTHLRKGTHKSCGCTFKGDARRRSDHPLFKVYSGMVQRCENPSNKDYAAYGAVGIKVCSRWRESFDAFCDDMGDRPNPSYSIERTDNNEGYSPGNCVWADKTTQTRNRRNTIYLNVPGVGRVTLSDAAKNAGLSYGVLHARLVRNGWDVDRALSRPLGRWV